MAEPDAFSLDAKYTLLEGTILLSGVQALVRLPLDQLRADRRLGLNTAGLISGYRGSPLAGLDLQLQRNAELLRAHQVVFMPGVNEDTGATMIYGQPDREPAPAAQVRRRDRHMVRQGAGSRPQRRCLQARQLRRRGALRRRPGAGRRRCVGQVVHHPVWLRGGALRCADADPGARQRAGGAGLRAARLRAVALLRALGRLQDRHQSRRRVRHRRGRPRARGGGSRPSSCCTAARGSRRRTRTCSRHTAAPIEHEIYDGPPGRGPAVRRRKPAQSRRRSRRRAPGWVSPPPARPTTSCARRWPTWGWTTQRSIATASGCSKSACCFRWRRRSCGSSPRASRRSSSSRRSAPLLELFVRDVLYHLAERPRVVGKRDEQERPLLPGRRRARRRPASAACWRRAWRSRIRPRRSQARMAFLRRAARRARADAGGRPRAPAVLLLGLPAQPLDGAAGGRDGGRRASAATAWRWRWTAAISASRQMGGEGAQWVGMAPFTGTPHMFQNLGDGTLFHSGTLAIRQAVAAGANITYKILLQQRGRHDRRAGRPTARSACPRSPGALEAEGVGRSSSPPTTRTSTRATRAGRRAWRSGIATGWTRRSACCATTPGVTALIHDQTCAAELRRLRKRGKAPDPPTRVFINQAVCEGCGDCGVKSNCLSVQPVETEFGRKTQIHQSSCNKDYSCLLGDCPAFVTVVPRRTNGEREDEQRQRCRPRSRIRRSTTLPRAGAEGRRRLQRLYDGHRRHRRGDDQPGPRHGGVLDGKYVVGLDQTGLSQKGGPVVSHLKIAAAPLSASSKIAAGQADCFLGFDILTATAAQNLDARPRWTDDRRGLDQPGADRRDGCRDGRALPAARRAGREHRRRARGPRRMSSSTPRRWPCAPLATTWRPT